MSEWWNKKNTKKWNTISERNMDNMEVDSSEIQYGTIGCSHDVLLLMDKQTKIEENFQSILYNLNGIGPYCRQLDGVCSRVLSEDRVIEYASNLDIDAHLNCIFRCLKLNMLSNIRLLNFGLLLNGLRSDNIQCKYYATMIISDVLQLLPFYCKHLLMKLISVPSAKIFWEDLSKVDPSQCLLAFRGMLAQQSLESSLVHGYNLTTKGESVIFRPFGVDTVHVYGIQLLRSPNRDASEDRGTGTGSGTGSVVGIAETQGARRAMRKLAQAVTLNMPVILEGCSGCGKSCLVRELARWTGNDASLLTLHLDDQTDSKALIGSYVCSDVPGEFVWQPGMIAQAMTAGRWLVIEDIDRASLEVIATITPLLGMKSISGLSSGVNIKVHPNFRIFGTRTLQSTTSASEDAVFHSIPSLRHFSYSWHLVRVDMPSLEEIRAILLWKHPSMAKSIVDILLSTYVCCGGSSAFASDGLFRGNASKGAREFTLRDVLKVANRISTCVMPLVNKQTGILTEEQRIFCFCELCDVFCGSIRDDAVRAQTVLYIASHVSEWKLSPETIRAHIIHRAPELVNTNTSMTSSKRILVGRAEMSIGGVASASSSITVDSDMGRNAPERMAQQYAFTKHSLRQLESIACAVKMNEPILLVGETGTGKTTSVQELADLMGQTLLVQNISLSTESSDLLGGFRPVSLRQLFRPLYEKFVDLFKETFSQHSNSEFLTVVAQLFRKESWSKLVKALIKAGGSAKSKLHVSQSNKNKLLDVWKEFLLTCERLDCNLSKILNTSNFAFAFVEGLLVDAMRKGHWVLLDEINLASPETLQGLVGMLDGQSLCLSDKGDVEPVVRHANFRVFAAMNPPTDVGKKELPAALRSRFTELYISEMEDRTDLLTVVSKYMSGVASAVSSSSGSLLTDIVDVYLGCRATAQMTLVDGAGQRPHFSLRSLTRALKSALAFMDVGLRPLNRVLCEGFSLSFKTQLVDSSRSFMHTYLQQSFQINDLGRSNKGVDMPPSRPGGRKSQRSEWILIEPFWLRAGPNAPLDMALPDSSGYTKFVLTSTVKMNIRDLAAGVAAGVSPILLQGPTSVGKTSMVEYLAKRCGYRCIRINNHEHTDVQEYIGGYVTGADGRLFFKYGVLVEALQRGDWIILDELNLAPSEVLEALNRLLDDNRELYIPETGETIRPAAGFTLFATQNPAGAYGGRKQLSRAFRNRFVEIFIGDLPLIELEEIVGKSCGIPPSHATILVNVMKELQLRRQQSSVFQGKHGSITTRDLIKWGRRHPQGVDGVAREGYMLLAERHRSLSEKIEIYDILARCCKTSFDVDNLFVDNPFDAQLNKTPLSDLYDLQNQMRNGEVTVDGVTGVAMTAAMRRLWVLCSRCLHTAEPILIIGETGSGKTTVSQLIAAHRKQRVRILNCHQSTETADIIGGLRPVRGRDNMIRSLLKHLQEIVQILNAEELSATRALLSNNPSYLEIDVATESNEINVNDVNVALLEVKEALSLITKTSTDTSVEASSQSLIQNSLDAPISSQLLQLFSSCECFWRRYNSIFEWQDGPLVEAMRCGDIFVLDEINLAEDAVIERLNSVLESSRTITLAEKVDTDSQSGDCVIVAHENFRFIATMNPGDDYGKRELSPALRSRFTEIYVPDMMASSKDDIRLIVSEVLQLPHVDLDERQRVNCNDAVADMMISFVDWFADETKRVSSAVVKISVREILAWAKFVSIWNSSNKISNNYGIYSQVYVAAVHGAQMLLLDGLGIGSAMTREQVRIVRFTSVQKLLQLCPDAVRNVVATTLSQADSNSDVSLPVGDSGTSFRAGFFEIPLGPHYTPVEANYVLTANNTKINFERILRAMQLPRPILLEGPPGSGKTSIISNLALLSGHKLVRINLSEHSELADLIGTDLPISSGGDNSSIQFRWCDGVFLAALKRGDWVLLDELNLAPQTVLEGLNACLDHRGTVFIPEIGKSFHCPPSFRVFCAQNPMSEGGGRKGLPQSFLSRFSRVFIESLSPSDMTHITMETYALKMTELQRQYVSKIVAFVQRLNYDVSVSNLFGRTGSPWEFNLRDIFRCCDLITAKASVELLMTETDATMQYLIADAIYGVFVSRMRTHHDANCVKTLFEEIFGFPFNVDTFPTLQVVSKDCVLFGTARLETNFDMLRFGSRESKYLFSSNVYGINTPLTSPHSKIVEIMGHCVNHAWPVLLVGPAGSGKRSLVRYLSHITGNGGVLQELSITPTTDSTDLLGSFEQANIYRDIARGMDAAEHLCASIVHQCLAMLATEDVLNEIQRDALTRAYDSATQTLSLFTAISSEIQNVISTKSIMLHSNASSYTGASTNIFQRMNDLVVSLRLTINLLQQTSVKEDSGAMISSMDSKISEMLVTFEKCYLQCNRSGSSGSGFEWVDGIVVNALRYGHWLLVDNVNLCSASILDRLNSLLETKGTLLLTESGEGRLLEPHPNFRVFFTMDSSFGEISRAMRNRCMEISVRSINEIVPSSSLETVQSQGSVLSHLSSVHGEYVWGILNLLYQKLLLAVTKGYGGSLTVPFRKLFSRACDILNLELSIGYDVRSAVISTVDAMFPSLSTSVDEILDVAASYHRGVTSSTNLNLYFSAVQNQLSSKLNMLSSDVTSDLFLLWVACTREVIDVSSSSLDWFASHVRHVAGKVTADSQGFSNQSVAWPVTETMNKVLSRDLLPYVANRLMYWCALVTPGSTLEFDKYLIHQFLTLISSQSPALSVMSWSDTLLDMTQCFSNLDVSVNERFALLDYLPAVLHASEDSVQTTFGLKCFVAALISESELQSLEFTNKRDVYSMLREISFTRAPQLQAEAVARHHCASLTDAIQLSDISSQFLSLYEMLFYYHSNESSSDGDSPTLNILLSAYEMVLQIDRVYTCVVHNIIANAEGCLTEDGCGASHMLANIKSLLSCRDVVGQVFLETSCDVQSTQLTNIAIGIRWCFKAAMKLAEMCLSNNLLPLPLGGDLNHSCQQIISLYSRFEREEAKLWKRPAMSCKISLWREGGHGAVPLTSEHCDTLNGILALIPDTYSHHLPDFIQSVLSPCTSSHCLRTDYKLMEDWVALLSTFYWAKSNELPQAIRDGQDKSFNLSEIVSMLTARFSKFSDQDVSHQDEGGDTASDLRKRIEEEMSAAGSLFLVLVAEQPVILLVSKLSNLLGSLALMLTKSPSLSKQSNNTVTEDILRPPDVLEAIAKKLGALKAIGTSLFRSCLKFTRFEPRLMREVKTLIWFLDSLGDRPELWDTSNYVVLLNLCVSYSCLMESVIYAFDTNNYSNHIGSVDYMWDSKIVKDICSGVHFMENMEDRDFSVPKQLYICVSEIAMSGSMRRYQLVNLELCLKLLDINALDVQFANSKAFQRLSSHDTAALTLGSSGQTRTKLLQVFNMIGRKSLTQDLSEVSGPSSRMDAWVYRVVAIVRSCRRAISPSSYSEFVTACNNVVLTIATDNVDIRSQALEGFCMSLRCIRFADHNSFAASAFEKCLLPALLLVAETSGLFRTGDKHITELGAIWSYVGMLQVLLTVPVYAIDPAVKPAIKASLLQKGIVKLAHHQFATQLHSSLSGGSLLTKSVENLQQCIDATEGKITALRQKAIHRSETAPDFSDVYMEIRSSCESLVDIERLKEMLNFSLSLSRKYDRKESFSPVEIDNAKLTISQEASWQGSVKLFIQRLERDYAAYSDITSSIISGLSEVAMGLRLSVGYAYHLTEMAVNMGSSASQKLSVPDAVRCVTSYPLCSALTMRDGEDFSNQAVSMVKDVFMTVDVLSHRSKNRLTNSQQLGNDVPSPRVVDSLSTKVGILLALSKLDYFVGNDIIDILKRRDGSDLFKQVLDTCVTSQLRAVAAKEEAIRQNSSMFKTREVKAVIPGELEIQDLEEREEFVAFRTHFPDHLIAFQAFEKSHVEQMEELADRLGSGADVGGESLSKQDLLEDHFDMFDEITSAAIVSFHARMTLLHIPAALRSHNRVWKMPNRKLTLQSFDGSDFCSEETRDMLRRNVISQTLVASKVLESGLSSIVAPGIDKISIGFSLMALKSMVDTCITGSKTEKDVVMKSWLSSLQCDSKAIDRDLMLLLDNSQVSEYRPANFHLDKNPKEVLFSAPYIRGMLFRAAELLDQFPGNEFLLQVCRISAIIALFGVSEPIGKLLASVQLLLRKAQEWEQFAARHVSLHEEMAGLSQLIIRWRKLELKSWTGMLRAKEVHYANKAIKFWFNLAASLRSTPANLLDSKASSFSGNYWPSLAAHSPQWLHADKQSKLLNSPEMNVYLQAIFDSVDGFMRNAIVGEFPTRLHLVRIFALELLQTCALQTASCAAQRQAASIVYGVWQYYEQFLIFVREFQETMKGPIQTKLKDEVKISKWDEITTYALVENSDKVHRKLNKFVREYESDVLDYPVTAVIRREVLGDIATEQGELKAATVVPSAASFFPCLPRLGECAPECKVEMQIHGADGDDSEVSEVVSVPVASSENDARMACYVRDNSLLKLNKAVSYPTVVVTSVACLDSSEVTYFEGSRVKSINSITGKIKTQIHKLLVLQVIDVEYDEMTAKHFEMKCRFGLQSCNMAEGLCCDIFERLGVLRCKDAGINRNVKHRAMMDLLHGLREEGISHLQSLAPSEIKDSSTLFANSNLLPLEFSSHLSFTASHGESSSDKYNHHLLEKAERYYIRNVCELNQIRSQISTTIAQDISMREVQLMIGLSENMFAETIKIRSVLGASLEDSLNFVNVVDELRYLISREHIVPRDMPVVFLPNQELLLSIFTYQRHSSNAVASVLLDLKELVETCTECELDSVVNPHSVLADSAAILEHIDAFVQVLHKKMSSQNASQVSILFNTDIGLFVDNGDISRKASFGKNDLLQALDVSHIYEKNARKFLTQSMPVLERIFSQEVIISTKQQLAEFLDTNVRHNAELHIELQSIDTEIDSTIENRFELTSLDENWNAPFKVVIDSSSQCVDRCMVAIQNLKNIVHYEQRTIQTSENDADEDLRPAPATVKGCFGEDVIIPSSLKDDSKPKLFDCVRLGLLATMSVRMHKITSCIQNVVSAILAIGRTTATPDKWALLKDTVSSLFPLFETMMALSSVLTEDIIHSYKSCGKLTYVAMRVFRVLLSKGFCSDTSKESEGGGGGDIADMDFEDDVEGTGMGEGDGKKDVSDQIENEEQLLGLKDDIPQESKPKDNKANKKLNAEEEEQGVEMTQDFDGEMYDLPEDKKAASDEEEENEEEELDREMGGEVDLDDIVDEKQWGDDEDDEDKQDPTDKEKETFEKDSKMKGETIDGEMRTKDDADGEREEDRVDEEDSSAEKGQKDNKKDSPEEAENGGEDVINEDKEELERDKPMGVDAPQSKNKEAEEDDAAEDDEKSGLGAELPDAETGDDGKEGEGEGGDIPDDMEIDDHGGEEGEEAYNNDPMDMDQSEGGDSDNEDSQDGEDDADGGERSDTEENANKLDDIQETNPIGGQGNLNELENPDSDDSKSEGDEAKDEMDIDTNHTARKAAAVGIRSSNGKDFVLNSGEDENVSNEEADEAKDGAENDTALEEEKRDKAVSSADEAKSHGKGGSGDGAGASENKSSGLDNDQSVSMSGNQESNPDRNARDQRDLEAPNPFRKLGDINKRWNRHLDMTSEKETKKKDQPKKDSSDKSSKYAYESDDEAESDNDVGNDDSEGPQVLGGIKDNDESHVPLRDQDMDDSGADNSQGGENADMSRNSVDDSALDEEADKPRNANERKDGDRDSIDPDAVIQETQSGAKRKRSPSDTGNNDKNQRDSDPPVVDKDLKNYVQKPGIMKQNSDIWNNNDEDEGADSAAEDFITSCDMEISEISHVNDVVGRNQAREDWMGISAKTLPECIRLCEALRLVMEPTLASRLQGDYRTGKRINMRRVISYVASGYRKDAIWLRRTKPSKREYQVMVMIDNSRSMCEAGPLALAAVNVLSGALSRLEVGDISVCSFADKVHQLHPFGKPLNDEAGANIISHFAFQEDRTLLASSLRAVLPLFEEAKMRLSSSSGGVALQICFIISDARIDSDNREHLMRLIREMAEKHVLALLIIVDKNADSKDSIFCTRSVDFTPTGIVTRSYLDNFPFPYYVAIHHTEALPDVLGDALKQWFELIRMQLDGK